MQQILTLLVAVAVSVLGQAPRPAANPQRFDYLVRADFFAGLAGDEARMKKAMDLCERTLAENPTHAEAMVWHGGGLMAQAGAAFQKSDLAKGGALFARGLKEMNDAVALAPDNPSVLIPRGATLLEATKSMPSAISRSLLESALGDYERVLEIQKPYFSTLGDHAKGELLFGLADGYARLGQQRKAHEYFQRLIKEAPTSRQTAKAREWMTTGTIPKSNGASCVGCHR